MEGVQGDRWAEEMQMKDRGRQREKGRETQRIKKNQTVKESLSTGRDEKDLNKGRSAGKRRDDCHRGDSQRENSQSQW